MQKRAQVTPFILLGIIIVIIAAAAIYFFGSSLTQQIDITPIDQAQLIPLQKQIEQCMLASVERTINTLQKNAFYLQATPYTLQYGGADINYLLYPENAPNKLNALEAVQDAISQQLEADIKTCSLDKLKLKLKTDKDAIAASTFIAENKIILTLDYPITVSKGLTSSQLKEFSVSKETDLGLMYNTIHDIVEGELTEEGFDQYQYMLKHPSSIIYKDNPDFNTALFLITSSKEQSYILFATRK